jgi:carbamoyltransferase
MFIGVTGYNHESSAALVDKNGMLVDFYREESLSRIKGDKSFPKRSIKKIFDTNNLKIKDIERVAFYERPLSAFLHIVKEASLHMPKSLGLLTHQFRNFNRSSVTCYLDFAKFFKGLENKLIYSDHHLSHTLTAIAYSNTKKDICSVVVDGFGDRSTASISQIVDPTEIYELWESLYPISLGLFYSSITDYLGFPINEGEYKVMGLASYGDSNSKLAKLVRELMDWDSTSNKLISDMSYFDYHLSTSNSFSTKLEKLLGPARNPFARLVLEDNDFQRWANIARGAQDLTIYLLEKIFAHAHKITNSRRFLFSGGVSMNSASIDSLAQLPFVDEIIVPPSPGDAGCAIGAAFYCYIKSNSYSDLKISKPSLFPSLKEIRNDEILTEQIISNEFYVLERDKNDAFLKAAELIGEGEVIGTVLSSSETGPRALGNRSLICDGKNKDAVKKLNTVIKKRSPFRPTAPAMRYEIAKKYYKLRPEIYDCYKSMSATCKCLKNNVSLEFPTTHVDGTARIQIVEKNSSLEKLLSMLEPMGIEILANSSLNVSGDPTCFDLVDGLMVCSRTKLRYLLTDLGLLKKLEN